MSDFRCVTVSPIELGAGVARATLRAGGIAVLDLELCPAGQLDFAAAVVREVPDAGVRIAADQIERLAGLIAAARGPIVLGLSGDGRPAGDVQRLAGDGREIWIEIGSGAELARVDDALPIAAIVGRGSECGGRCGSESAFILAQHLARRGSHPFYLQGGIGVHSAAACRVAGAAGVVLDDALLLMPETTLPPKWRSLLERIAPEETSVTGGRWRFVSRPDFPASRELLRLQDPSAVRELLGWGDPAHRVWPLGESAGRARELAARYGRIGRLLHAIIEGSACHVSDAAMRQPLSAAAPLAQSHGTRYPIVQGPMTRVSDRVELAISVAENGALPLIALALMRAPAIEALLLDAKRALAGRSWGIGILGFVPRDLWEEQLTVVERVRPPFALIAGGRPDHAARLEALGIATYVHAPAAVLGMFLEQGSRRLVFEGGECGGHVGPLHSFTLWEIAIDSLLRQVSPGDSQRVHALFAGGIHDALSSAMVAAMAAPLTTRGMRIGVLMGTAYLFTEELVTSGAITAAFQQQAIDCANTVTIETKPGHSIRCVPTPFIDTFARTRGVMAQTVSAGELGDALEQLIAGRLRIASKGLRRRGEVLEPVPEREQLAEGMYMIGEAATLRRATTTIADVHEDVSAGGTRLLAEAAKTIRPREQKQNAAAVAIVGAGCILPGAQDPDTFWRNLLDRVDCVREIPIERWDWRLYYDADPAAPDRIISKWGTFIDPLPFDPLHYGIPPRSLLSISVAQLLALEATRRALQDAGYGDGIEDERLRERTAVVFAAGNTADLEQMYITRSTLPLVSGNHDDARRRLPEWTEESFPGILANVVAGRVANRFDFGGMNVALDAACAGSLAALDVAVRELEEGRSDLVIAGGMELEQTPMAYMAFSKTKALSPRGKARVFDAGADGIVIGEGVVVLVLKRLADAERDGDRIYAVIRSVAGSSDGKGLGLTAPRSAGQRRALDRAHARAGIDASSLGLYEAHGTGTAAGDAAELETISVALRRSGAAARSCTIGSAKNLIGHTRAAAGMTGLLKAALALRHRVLPPHAGMEEPMAELRDASSPLRVAGTPQPWIGSGSPRRAGVSAFGFGGTNFHVVLEEYTNGPAPAGANRWPCELFLIDGDDLDRVEGAIDRVPFADLAYTCALNASPNAMAIVASDAGELRRGVAAARGGGDESAPADEIAFLFPGQGSQSVGMGGELALYFPEVRGAIEEAERVTGESLAQRIFPALAFSDEARNDDERALAATTIAQPAIGAVSCGVLDLVRRLGIVASRVAGHSYGELVALHAAGVLTRDELSRLSSARGRVMSAADAGAMAVVAADADAVCPHLGEGVVVANRNAPDQTVVSGPVDAIERAMAALNVLGITARRLKVSGGFHSPLMRPAREPFAAALAGIEPLPAHVPVHANRDGVVYPAEADAVRGRLLEHLEQPVDFIAQIEAMYAAGVRTFIEIGPGHALTSLVRRILRDRPHRALGTDGGLRGYLETVAELWRAGVAIDAGALYSRELRYADLVHLPAAAAPAWMIDGGRIWRSDSESRNAGELPLLDSQSAERLVPHTAHEDPLVAAYREYEETMRRFLEQQERVLMQVVGADGTRAPSPMPLLPPQERTAAGDGGGVPKVIQQVEILSRDEITARLVAVVSDRTGYPPSMLDLHQDLEAELGIDSIKRIEIVSAMQKSLPAHIAGALQSRFDELTRVTSLWHLVDAVMRAAATAAPEVTPETRRGVPRFVMRGAARELSGPRRAPLSGLHVVTEDRLGVAHEVVALLRGLGAAAYLVRQSDLESDEALENRLLVLSHMHGPVAGIVHLAALGRRAPDDVAGWHDDASVVAKRFFRMLQMHADSLQCVIAVSQLGGEWGRAGICNGTAAAGAAHGLLQSLHGEYPHVRVLAIDAGDEVEAGTIVGELLTNSGDAEVGYAGGVRVVYSAAAAPRENVEPRDLKPRAGWVVLVTGGARGITAEVCRDLAAPGVRLAIVGRTPLGERLESEQEIEAGRQTLLAALHARSEGLEREEREAEIRRIDALRRERLRERERLLSLEALRAAGGIVEYHALDVRDEAALTALLDELYERHGRIDAVVHGAGIIEDQWIENKDAASFDRVFDTKASSAWVLTQRLRAESLRWIVFFGSTSGRFGNQGQADYAAANEVMNRLAWQLDARAPNARVAVINWGPWSGGGMAGEGTRELLESRGLVPIDPEEGRRFFADELAFGRKGDVEIIAGDGPWAAESDPALNAVIEIALFAMTVEITAGAAP